MNVSRKGWLEAIVRAVVVAGTSTVAGYVLYPYGVFTPNMVAFQFISSGCTSGLAYASLRSPNARSGLASLVLWFVVLTWLIETFNPWLLALNTTYVVEIAGAVFCYEILTQKPLFKLAISRILLAGVLLTLANALIIVTLDLISVVIARGHFAWFFRIIGKSLLINTHYGALIGLAVGCGIEIANLFVTRLNKLLEAHQDRVSQGVAP